MEEFGKVIRRRIAGFECMAILAVIVGIIDVFKILPQSQDGGFSDGMVGGMSVGTVVALGMLAVVQIIRLRRVLKDEKLMKLLYNKEHDERLQAIRSKAGMPMILIMSIAMIVAGVIGSRFNETIFYTLFAAGFVQILVGAVVKIYCMKTM